MWSKKCQERSDCENKLQQAVREIQQNMKQLEKDVSVFNEYMKTKYENFCSEVSFCSYPKIILIFYLIRVHFQEREIMDRFEKILEAARRRNQHLLEEDL